MKKMGLFLAIESGYFLKQSAVFTVNIPSEPRVKKAEVLEELCVVVKNPAYLSYVFTPKTITQVFGKL
jgi:hypothetical protein